jgi:hypothetical protein
MRCTLACVRVRLRGVKPDGQICRQRSHVAMLTWIAIVAAAALCLSALVSLGLGAVLGMIGRDVGELFESELWTVAPTARAKAQRS